MRNLGWVLVALGLALFLVWGTLGNGFVQLFHNGGNPATGGGNQTVTVYVDGKTMTLTGTPNGDGTATVQLNGQTKVEPLTSDSNSNGNAPATANPATTTTSGSGTVNGMERRASGQNVTIPFNADEAVAGWFVTFNGVTYGGPPNGCYIQSATVSGTVTSGVVNYYPAEIAGMQVCSTQTVAPVTSLGSQNPAAQNPTSGLYNIPPQPEIGHPSLYMETGVP